MSWKHLNRGKFQVKISKMQNVMKHRWTYICLNVIKKILIRTLMQHQLKMLILWMEIFFASLSLIFNLKKSKFFFSILRAYNKSSSYRKCLYSIFGRNEVCSFEKYPYSYEYSKTYWKLVLSSCLVENRMFYIFFYY